GIQININITKWLQKKESGKLQEVKEQHLVEVPRYVDGTPGELWVIRNPDESIAAISSNYQPNHNLWPGPLKGWPVPSLVYQRERWDIYIKQEKGCVANAKEMLNNLQSFPEKEAADTWEDMLDTAKKYSGNYEIKSPLGEIGNKNRDLLKKFSGPKDPEFSNWLKKDYERYLKDCEKKLNDIERSRP
ncbi:hypothetical protein, partial [Janthinobacterium agaricidamnosum]